MARLYHTLQKLHLLPRLFRARPPDGTQRRVGVVTELPTEIVQQILALFSTTFSACDPASFPWFLGHICSGWRAMFLSMTANFWSTISVTYPRRPHGSLNRFRDLVQLFLQRNPTAPFSFEIRLLYPIFNYPPLAGDDIRHILEMLIDQSMRWRSVLFEVHTPSDLLLLTRAKNRLPLLQAVRLNHVLYGSEPFYDVFQTAPSLNTVHMQDIANWTFDWSNLTDVRLFRFEQGAQNFTAALPQMVKLERLTLICAYYGPTLSSIVLPRMTKLYCHPNWLRFLNTPALEELTIYDCYTNSLDLVLPFLRRSSCDILRLHIEIAQAATVGEIIRHTPNLVHLELYTICDIGLVFQQLIASREPGCKQLARRMVSLDITVSHLASNDMILLRDLISSRTGTAADHVGCTKLQRLDVCGGFMFVAFRETMKDIAALCKERRVQCALLEDFMEGNHR
ncbi:hypothetical protein APHAL10511_003215 [Amanita phalloides]|nr:hypothetical protein APHAL10511_003215 [Amanita phalloides]